MRFIPVVWSLYILVSLNKFVFILQLQKKNSIFQEHLLWRSISYQWICIIYNYSSHFQFIIWLLRTSSTNVNWRKLWSLSKIVTVNGHAVRSFPVAVSFTFHFHSRKRSLILLLEYSSLFLFVLVLFNLS